MASVGTLAGMATFNRGHRKADGREYSPFEFIEPRDQTVRLRIGAGELASWRRFAELQGRSLSELIRHYVNDGCRVYQVETQKSLDLANGRRDSRG